jgi:CubicO group peptidase (beta-lactamase class C family)
MLPNSLGLTLKIDVNANDLRQCVLSRSYSLLKRKRMKSIVVLSVLIAGLIFSDCSGQKSYDRIPNKINLQLDSLLLDADIQAVSIGIIDGDDVYESHIGKLLNGEEPNGNTLYEIASLTKTFTGTLLAFALVEKKITIDDDIRLHLKDSFPNLEYEGYPITVRHLVTHQSGLPHMFPNHPELFEYPNWDELPFKINELQGDFSKEDFFRELSMVNLDSKPGTGLNYSNVGANLLGYLLEEIYNQPFEELLAERVFIPRNMENTLISKVKLNLGDVAVGQNTNRIRMPIRVEKSMNAEGGIISNTADMVKYMEYHLDESDQVISVSHQHLWEGSYGDFEAGLFWQINKNGNKPDIIFQNGGAFGTSSWITLIPEEKIGVFIVTNVSGQNIHQKLSEAVDKIISEIQNSRL